MRKLKIKTFLFATLIIIFVLGGLGYFFNFYNSDFLKKKIHEVTLEKTRTRADLISDIISDEYDRLTGIVHEYVPQGQVVSNFLDILLDLENDPRVRGSYKPFTLEANIEKPYLSNMATVIPESVNAFYKNRYVLMERKDFFQKENLTVNSYDIYFSFPYVDFAETDLETAANAGDGTKVTFLLLVQNFSEILDGIIKDDPGYYYLINTFGNIVAEKNAPTLDGSTYFYNMIRAENKSADDLVTGIQSGELGSLPLTFQGSNQIAYYDSILQGLTDSQYALIYIKSESAIMAEVSNIERLTLAIFGGILMIFMLDVLFVFYLVNKRNFELENARFSYAHAKTFVLATTRRGRITYRNRAVVAKIKGANDYKTLYELSGKNDKIMDLAKRQQPFTLFFHTPDEIDLYVRFVALKKRGGYQIIGTDVTEDTLELERARRLALYNHLTNLPNVELLNDEILNVIKTRPNSKHALLLFDIMNFRNINRVFGRVVGDNVLIKVGQFVNESLNSNEKLFNLEVDNFAVLMTGIENYTMATDTAKKVCKLFERPITINSNLLAVKVKVGIYNFEENEMGHVEFSKYAITNAKLALKKAKESRQMDVATYDISIGQVLTREMVMETDLKIAIENHEFEMHYQPQYNVISNKIVGFEALLRWNNTKYTNESPEKYIRLAEQNGLIIQIGKFVVEETFKMAKDLEGENIRIALNISPVQLLQSGFVRDVDECARRNQLNPNKICIEITETSLIESFTEIVDKLKLLKDLGFSIHLDDFGTGYSSMLYLKELPIDALKIDREFVKTIAYDQYSRAIVSKVISLAKSLDLDIIVEGIETQEQSVIVTKSGANIIQGFLISKAVPAPEVRELIRKYNKNRK